MKIFRLSNGQIVQIIDKEKIQKWTPEMPVIFINYLLDKKMDSYGTSKDQAEIRAYLNDILETVAVPKLTNALKSDKKEIRLNIANNLVEISKKKPELVKDVLEFLQEAEQAESDQAVKTTISQVLKNYEKSQKKKEYEAKRKKMKELDKKLVAGEISGEDYANERKEFLNLGAETGADEE